MRCRGGEAVMRVDSGQAGRHGRERRRRGCDEVDRATVARARCAESSPTEATSADSRRARDEFIAGVVAKMGSLSAEQRELLRGLLPPPGRPTNTTATRWPPPSNRRADGGPSGQPWVARAA